MNQDYYPLNKVPSKVEKMGGKRINLSTVYRWSSRGIQGVRLRTLAIGGTLYTCDPWVDEFFQGVTEKRLGNCSAHVAPTRRASMSKAAAEAELAAAGI